MKQLLNNRIVNNASWIIGTQIMKAFIGLAISMITARYLGPSNFGLINYAGSIVTFAVPVMNLGLSNILVQQITNYPEEEGKIIGTSVLLSVCSAFFCIAGIWVFTYFVDAGERTTNLVVILYSLLLIFQAVELIGYWFQAKLLSKYQSTVSLAAYIVVSIYKVFLLVSKASVYLFAVSNSIDYLLIAILLLIIYQKLGGQHLEFSRETAKRMLNSSKHYIVSSLMVTIFAQTDKIMLKLMIDEAAVGYYSAAFTCAGYTSFVFCAIIDSFRPVIFQYKKTGDEVLYEKKIEQLYCLIIYGALIQSLLMTVFSKIVIHVLYGSAYEPSILALQIVVWYTTFAYMGAVRNVWILGENKQKYLWLINLGGASINVLLNFLLIPIWGIYGAAVASLLTQIFTNVFMNIIIWPLRRNNLLMIKGLNPSIIVNLVRNIK